MKRGTWLQARREELRRQNPNNASAFSQRGVAQHIGVTGAAISHLETTDAMPTLELALKLAKYYKRTPEWVMTGKEASSEHGIPIVGTTQTGLPDTLIEKGLNSGQYHQFIDMPGSSGGVLYALKIVENCSSPVYRNGDVVIADIEGPAMPGEDYLVKLRSDDSFIAILTMVSHREDGFLFNSVNEQFDRKVIEQSDILCMHPIVAVAKAWTIKKI